KTSGINAGYYVWPNVGAVFGQVNVAVAWRRRNRPVLPDPAEVLLTSVLPKKAPSMFPVAFAPQISGQRNLIPILEVIARKLLEPAALMSYPFATSFSYSGYKLRSLSRE